MDRWTDRVQSGRPLCSGPACGSLLHIRDQHVERHEPSRGQGGLSGVDLGSCIFYHSTYIVVCSTSLSARCCFAFLPIWQTPRGVEARPDNDTKLALTSEVSQTVLQTYAPHAASGIGSRGRARHKARWMRVMLWHCRRQTDRSRVQRQGV